VAQLPGQALGDGSSELAVSYADDPGSEELDAAAIAKALRRPEETEGESERSSEGDVQVRPGHAVASAARLSPQPPSAWTDGVRTQAMGMDFLSRERERLDEARDKLFRAAGSGSLRDLKAAVRVTAPLLSRGSPIWTGVFVRTRQSGQCLQGRPWGTDDVRGVWEFAGRGFCEHARPVDVWLDAAALRCGERIYVVPKIPPRSQRERGPPCPPALRPGKMRAMLFGLPRGGAEWGS
jgi:hypothetical protein